MNYNVILTINNSDLINSSCNELSIVNDNFDFFLYNESYLLYYKPSAIKM